MEHIVQFGISIDDDAIKKSIEKNVLTNTHGQARGVA